MADTHCGVSAVCLLLSKLKANKRKAHPTLFRCSISSGELKVSIDSLTVVRELRSQHCHVDHPKNRSCLIRCKVLKESFCFYYSQLRVRNSHRNTILQRTLLSRLGGESAFVVRSPSSKAMNWCSKSPRCTTLACLSVLLVQTLNFFFFFCCSVCGHEQCCKCGHKHRPQHDLPLAPEV